MPHPTWPFFNLAIRTPMVELRPVDEALGVQLALLADRGIHPRGEMPFCVPWTDIDPPERYWASMQFYWRCWGSFTTQDWHLPFATLVDGEVVGMQEVAATGFVDLGVIRTGSWIGQEFQGRGSAGSSAPRCCTSRSTRSAPAAPSRRRTTTTRPRWA